MARKIIVVALAVILLLVLFYFTCIPSGREAANRWDYSLHKVDDATSYRTRKQVEDSCRAMIASYTADKLKYEQYAASDSTEQRGWGNRRKCAPIRRQPITTSTFSRTVMFFKGISRRIFYQRSNT